MIVVNWATRGDLWISTDVGVFHSRNFATNFYQISGFTSAVGVALGAPKIIGGYPAVFASGVYRGVAGYFHSDNAGVNCQYALLLGQDILIRLFQGFRSTTPLMGSARSARMSSPVIHASTVVSTLALMDVASSMEIPMEYNLRKLSSRAPLHQSQRMPVLQMLLLPPTLLVHRVIVVVRSGLRVLKIRTTLSACSSKPVTSPRV
jgi:hypothetical protein